MSEAKKFTSGKYFGKSHKYVCSIDPQYIIGVYETHMDNGGISRELYRLAVLLIEEANEAEEDGRFHEDLEDYG